MRDIASALEKLLPLQAGRKIGLHEPTFGGQEKKYLAECVDSTMVSSIGPFVDRFEKMLCEYTGSAHAIAASTGTAALHTCLVLAGVEKGDEVLIPALSFIATANAVTYCDAVPHFVDSNEATLGVDPAKLRLHLASIAEVRSGACFNRKTGRRIRALVPMHTFGHPVDLDALAALCQEFALVLIEDAAESLGSFYKGKHTGTIGKLAALSFNGNKIVTTGGGGAILTQDPVLAKRAKHLTTTAKLPHAWAFVHDEVGFNYRLPNLNAALGCAQMEQLPAFVERKRALAEKYHRAFEGIPGVRVFVEPKHARSNYWLNTLILEGPNADKREELLEILHARGILARPVWTLTHKLAMYRDRPTMDLSQAESLERRIVNVPSSVTLSEAR